MALVGGKIQIRTIYHLHSHIPLSTFSHFLLSSKSELYSLTKHLFSPIKIRLRTYYVDSEP